MHMKNYLLPALALVFFSCNSSSQSKDKTADSTQPAATAAKDSTPARSTTLDTALYNKLSAYLANGDTTGRWPVKKAPYPLPGAVLPFNRVVAYYGTWVNKKMGALGKWPVDTMIPKLLAEVKKWNDADTTIKSIPALHYIATTAQGAAGADGKWRARMSAKWVDTTIARAKAINALTFIDVQVGLSTVQAEVPVYEKYFADPTVHFGIDPEFAMNAKGGKRPGSVIGSLDAADINWIIGYLAAIVKKYNLPPKILVVHRFTQGMVTNADKIKPVPEVQVVMDMDGWGYPEKKKSTYYSWIAPQPVQFTGFKLFYVNDTEKSGQKEMMSQQDVLKLRPKPIYIQYQ